MVNITPEQAKSERTIFITTTAKALARGSMPRSNW